MGRGEKIYKCLILGSILAGIALAKLPTDFEFGVSTAAFQIQGAWLDDGKGMSVWDIISHTPGFIADGSKPEIADNSYHKFQSDIKLMKHHGIQNYRLSISWPRIIPQGQKGSPVNQVAIKHYRKQLEKLIKAGITPHVTLWHGDLPANLLVHGYGFVDRYFPDHFEYYADVAFKNFGDLVKNWFTFNEPWCAAVLDDFDLYERNIKPYQIQHNFLLAHAQAVQLYRTKYQAAQKGLIGIVLNSEMYIPKNMKDPKDVEAATRTLMFTLGAYSDPIFVSGDYPQILQDRVGSRLPTFTEEQKAMLKGSADFYAINHYFTKQVQDGGSQVRESYWDDVNATFSFEKSWPRTDTDWSIYPEGMHDLLMFIQTHWIQGSGIPIWITENGIALQEENIITGVLDQKRVTYLQDYLEQVDRAIQDGANVRQYFVWSLLDNYEWGSGFSQRFGLTYVHYSQQPKKFAQQSFKWYAQFIQSVQNPQQLSTSHIDNEYAQVYNEEDAEFLADQDLDVIL